ncbi:efflux RND transporter periplasmic adaptor subunit [Pigmentiphaga litoralis]|uniref:efflux RND transporter periplasmic adaptor subunit n=1 Tax=Pigmentiphaga litoralis TaxID=516702 RepID=UPI003B429808
MKTMKRSTLIVTLVVLLVIVGVAVFVARRPAPSEGTTPADKQAAAAPRPSLTVTVEAPQSTQLTTTLSANGNIAAWQEASVGSESAGLKLSEVRVNVGDTVKKGQVLATFSGETVQADVAQARASLAEAKANAADAANNASRARTLEQTGALSQQQINQYATNAETARARVEAAEAVLAAQQVRGRNTQVLAPDDGVISSRTATVGSVVGAGTELFKLIRQGRLEWRAEVTSAELGRINVGMPAVIVGASGARVHGKVRSIAPTVDPQTRAALVYVDVLGVLPADAPAPVAPAAATGAVSASPGAANTTSAKPAAASLPAGKLKASPVNMAQTTSLKAGMFARGDFELGQARAVTVPQASIVPRDGFNHVLLLQPDNRVAQLKIETGRRVGDRVEVITPCPPMPAWSCKAPAS